MNWKRGLHRVFLVLGALWIAFAVFIRTDQLDGHLYLQQTTLEGQVAMDTKVLAAAKAPVGTTLSTEDIDTFIEEDIKRDQMAAKIPASTLSPMHIVIADYSDEGQRITLPKGYKLDAPPASRRVNLAGIGVLQFPGALDDASVTSIITRNFARSKKYDIFDLVAVENEGKKRALDQNQKQLAEVIGARLFRHRLLGIFDAEHRTGTLGIAFIPPTVIYVLFAGAFLALRWIARGFRSSASVPPEPERKGPAS